MATNIQDYPNPSINSPVFLLPDIQGVAGVADENGEKILQTYVDGDSKGVARLGVVRQTDSDSVETELIYLQGLNLDWCFKSDGIYKDGVKLLNSDGLTLAGLAPTFYINDTTPANPLSWYFLAQVGHFYIGTPGNNFIDATSTGLGVFATAPAVGLAVAGPIEAQGDCATNGIIITDANSVRWRIVVDTSGNLSTVAA